MNYEKLGWFAAGAGAAFTLAYLFKKNRGQPYPGRPQLPQGLPPQRVPTHVPGPAHQRVGGYLVTPQQQYSPPPNHGRRAAAIASSAPPPPPPPSNGSEGNFEEGTLGGERF